MPGSRSDKVPGFCRSDAASTKPVVSLPSREQQQGLQNVRARAVSQLSRRARTQQLAQDQAQVERADVNQLPLQDVVPSPQVAAPHPARLVAVREAALDQLAAPSQ